MLASEDICAVVEMVMNEMTDLPVEAGELQPRPLEFMGYDIDVTGAFNGSLSVGTNSSTALELASRMLSTELLETTDDDVEEVMAELTNMIGGNVKSLLPGPSTLSIPTRRNHEEDNVNPPVESQTVFVRCGDRPLWVTLNRK